MTVFCHVFQKLETEQRAQEEAERKEKERAEKVKREEVERLERKKVFVSDFFTFICALCCIKLPIFTCRIRCQ